ncbi:hypothetical protein AVEN_124300-1 [Araneus ventricosus]|uniref:Uncharacterized protein n=1 Tax=Araneus ventricosus TaxID=182803 RepID=A0A4Y2LNW4_ARAVE|nr:hypothetical protein AVEN_124300-1 [Araneus ventricosus]
MTFTPRQLASRFSQAIAKESPFLWSQKSHSCAQQEWRLVVFVDEWRFSTQSYSQRVFKPSQKRAHFCGARNPILVHSKNGALSFSRMSGDLVHRAILDESSSVEPGACYNPSNIKEIDHCCGSRILEHGIQLFISLIWFL